MKANQKGFSVVEFLLLFVIVAIVGFVGWFVWNARSDSDKNLDTQSETSSSAKPLAAKELTEKIENAEIPLEKTENAPVSNPRPAGADEEETSTSYISKYDGFSFSYPADYRETIWSSTSDSSAITVFSTENNVLISYGSPVEVSKQSCNDAAAPKMYIHDVKELSNTDAPRQLFVIQYSYTYQNELIKSIAVTDWEGGTPAVGTTNKCNYRPVFKSKKNTDVWFNISDTSDAYRSKSLTMEEFVKKSDVKEAIAILSSGKY